MADTSDDEKRDEVQKRMLETPPKPHQKGGEPKDGRRPTDQPKSNGN